MEADDTLESPTKEIPELQGVQLSGGGNSSTVTATPPPVANRKHMMTSPVTEQDFMLEQPAVVQPPPTNVSQQSTTPPQTKPATPTDDEDQIRQIAAQIAVYDDIVDSLSTPEPSEAPMPVPAPLGHAPPDHDNDPNPGAASLPTAQPEDASNDTNVQSKKVVCSTPGTPDKKKEATVVKQTPPTKQKAEKPATPKTTKPAAQGKEDTPTAAMSHTTALRRSSSSTTQSSSHSSSASRSRSAVTPRTREGQLSSRKTRSPVPGTRSPNTRKNLETEKLKEYENEKFKECTFRPSINNSNSSGYSTQHRERSSTSPFDALYEHSRTKKQLHEWQELQNKECTFRPTLSSKSAKTGSSRVSMGIVPDPTSKIKKTQEVDLGRDKECTFRPKINTGKTPREHKSMIEDLSTKGDKHEKLVQQYNTMQLKECTFKPKINPLPAGTTARVMETTAGKLEKTAQKWVDDEQRHCTFKPQINNSAKNVKSKVHLPQEKPGDTEKQSTTLNDITNGQSGGNGVPPPLPRVAKMANNKNNTTSLADPPTTVNTECTFKPKINEKSVQPKTAAAPAVESMEEKRRRAELAAKQREEQEIRRCTFRPNLCDKSVKLRENRGGNAMAPTISSQEREKPDAKPTTTTPISTPTASSKEKPQPKICKEEKPDKPSTQSKLTPLPKPTEPTVTSERKNTKSTTNNNVCKKPNTSTTATTSTATTTTATTTSTATTTTTPASQPKAPSSEGKANAPNSGAAKPKADKKGSNISRTTPPRKSGNIPKPSPTPRNIPKQSPKRAVETVSTACSPVFPPEDDDGLDLRSSIKRTEDFDEIAELRDRIMAIESDVNEALSATPEIKKRDNEEGDTLTTKKDSMYSSPELKQPQFSEIALGTTESSETTTETPQSDDPLTNEDDEDAEFALLSKKIAACTQKVNSTLQMVSPTAAELCSTTTTTTFKARTQTATLQQTIITTSAIYQESSSTTMKKDSVHTNDNQTDKKTEHIDQEGAQVKQEGAVDASQGQTDEKQTNDETHSGNKQDSKEMDTDSTTIIEVVKDTETDKPKNVDCAETSNDSIDSTEKEAVLHKELDGSEDQKSTGGSDHSGVTEEKEDLSAPVLAN